MIEIGALTEADRGRQVRYTSTHGDKIEVGRITSWNKHYVFVRYHQQIHPYPLARYGTTSEATNPEDLEFA